MDGECGCPGDIPPSLVRALWRLQKLSKDCAPPEEPEPRSAAKSPPPGTERRNPGEYPRRGGIPAARGAARGQYVSLSPWVPPKRLHHPTAMTRPLKMRNAISSLSHIGGGEHWAEKMSGRLWWLSVMNGKKNIRACPSPTLVRVLYVLIFACVFPVFFSQRALIPEAAHAALILECIL